MKKIGSSLLTTAFTNQVAAFIKAVGLEEVESPVMRREGAGIAVFNVTDKSLRTPAYFFGESARTFCLFEGTNFYLEVIKGVNSQSDRELYVFCMYYFLEDTSLMTILCVKYANLPKEGLFLDINVFPKGCNIIPEEHTPLESTPVDVVVLPAGCHVHVVESGPLAEFAAKAGMITRFLKEMKQHLNLPI